jgi:carbonic anhydrase
VRDASIHPDSRPSAAPQNPIAVVLLSCSDSRVPSELVFDQGVGALFVIRVAGNTYDRLAFESICFAVSELGTRLILVIGHDECGAVTAAIKAYPQPDAGPMLLNIYPAVRTTHGQAGDAVANAISANAVLVAARLASEPALADWVARGELWIAPARYALASGRVELLRAPGADPDAN